MPQDAEQRYAIICDYTLDLSLRPKANITSFPLRTIGENW